MMQLLEIAQVPDEHVSISVMILLFHDVETLCFSSSYLCLLYHGRYFYNFYCSLFGTGQ